VSLTSPKYLKVLGQIVISRGKVAALEHLVQPIETTHRSLSSIFQQGVECLQFLVNLLISWLNGEGSFEI
jgi:hypothetical protein